MFGLLGRLFLDKEARKALEKRDKVKRAIEKRNGGKLPAKAGAAKGGAVSERDAAIAQMQSKAKDLVSPERAELIKHAMEVHRAKAKILNDLDDATREKLVALALKQLLNQDQDPKK